MSSKIRIKRGLKKNLPVLDTGEFALCTDTNEVFIGNNGSNVGITKVSDQDLKTNDKTLAGAINEIKSEMIVVSSTAPSSPKINQIWIDTTNKLLKYYSGTAWVILNAVYSD